MLRVRTEGLLLLLSRSVVSDSVRPHRRQPTKLRRPWDSPGKNTGVGCHCLLRRTEGLQWLKASCLLFLQYPSFKKYTRILWQPTGWILGAQDYIRIELLLSKFSQASREPIKVNHQKQRSERSAHRMERGLLERNGESLGVREKVTGWVAYWEEPWAEGENGS